MWSYNLTKILKLKKDIIKILGLYCGHNMRVFLSNEAKVLINDETVLASKQ